MKLLFIVTRMYVECSNMRNEFTQWDCDQDIHKFNEYGFLCIEGCEYKNYIESGKIDQGVDKILQEIQTKIQSQEINEIGIIFHPHYEADKNSQDIVLRRWGEFVEVFKQKKGIIINSIQISFVEDYSSAMGDFYKKIKKLCNSCRTQGNDCEKLIKELWRHFSKKDNVKLFSLLKHRLMHLLGPIDNDLQALWDEAERTGRKGFDPEKWREVCEAYKDYDLNKILCDALDMIKESINEIKRDLSNEKQTQVQGFEGLIDQAKSNIRCQGNVHSDIDNFVKLTKEVNDLLVNIKLDNIENGYMKKVYEELKNKAGKNPIHEWFEELDKKLESLIWG